jgi:steroid 5-alpha reductase family enzyme
MGLSASSVEMGLSLASKIVNPATGAVNWLYPVSSVFLAQTGLFLYCQKKRDNSYIDVMWSLTFILPNVMILGSQLALGLPVTPRAMITNALVAAWGLRLAMHIGMRHNGEDYRYAEFRRWMSKDGQAWYYIQAFSIIFMLQASLAVVVNASTLYQTAYHGA